ncbi:pentapeptide repeat-containing protein [Streptomyces sp. NBC_01092]|uniref:pentapeptide repeat-containing protein n=1 Tax=Streptomyces sp. NBC_01092 TaxID=2903748 RepID=UPI0038693027
MTPADLIRADLIRADLIRADLTRADLTRAGPSEAHRPGSTSRSAPSPTVQVRRRTGPETASSAR